MSEAALIIGLVLLAVLVGALLPVLYHAVQTLKSLKQFTDTAAPRLDRALQEITETSARINRIGASLEREGERLQPLFDSAASLGQTVQSLRRSLQSTGVILTALGPAVLAGLSAFMSRRDRSKGGEADEEADERAGPGEAGPGTGAAPISPPRAEEEPGDGH